MPAYSYIAKSFKGDVKTGLLEAKDMHQLAQTLRQKGYILIRADLEKSKTEKSDFLREIIPSFLKRISLKEKLMFARNLQVMVSSALPLPKSLETLAYQSHNKRFRKILLNIKDEIIKGKNFSDALSKYPNVFSGLFQNMIKVGEESGTMEEVLKVLTRHIEREHELKGRVKGAMIYPAVIICAMIGIGILMMIMVVPKLSKAFEDMNIKLPLTTRIIIGLGNFLANRWYFVIIIVLFLIILVRFAFKRKGFKRIFDRLVLKIPIISPLIKKINSAYTVRSLGSLTSCGVPIVRSLEIISRVMENVHYKQALLTVAEEVKKGGKLSTALKPYEQLYPLLVTQMIEVGEETGETSNILEKLADFFEEDVENATKNLTAVIEPFLMMLVGTAVGFFAVSMIQPIYSMMGTI